MRRERYCSRLAYVCVRCWSALDVGCAAVKLQFAHGRCARLLRGRRQWLHGGRGRRPNQTTNAFILVDASRPDKQKVHDIQSDAATRSRASPASSFSRLFFLTDGSFDSGMCLRTRVCDFWLLVMECTSQTLTELEMNSPNFIQFKRRMFSSVSFCGSAVDVGVVVAVVV